MSRLLASLCALSLCAALVADEAILPQDEALPELSELFSSPAAPAPAVQVPMEPIAPAIAAPAPAPKLPEIPFSPFTGRIKGKKVRLRLAADLDSQVIKELGKGELLSVIGEKGDFWVVEAPQGVKAYVFRSFVLDNVIEGNRVNVRLEPSLDSPVIAHLNAGEKVNGTVSAVNSKWYEIAPPTSTRFYVAKEFISFAGGPEMKAQADKKRNSGEKLLQATSLLTTAELNKPFEDINIDKISQNLKTVMNDYSDFPDLADKARDSLTKLQENYLQKRIAFLETKSTPSLVEESLSLNDGQAGEAAMDAATDKMKLWEPIEEALYLSWAQINESKSMEEYYEEQKLASVTVTGLLEAYASPVRNKPGDFILRDKELPVAYVYSPRIDLGRLVGKKVTLLGAPRSNNNFAFPAYVVLSVE